MDTETRDARVAQAKGWRQRLDVILQEMKEQQGKEEKCEYGRHLSLSITHLEDSIMRQGMRLKALDAPNPYPSSYDPSNLTVHPTADNLKL